MRIPLLALAAALSLPGATHFVIVAGLGGEPEYEQRFAATAKEIELLVKQSNPGGRVDVHSGPAATKAKISDSFAAIAKSSGAQDGTVFMMIGHGSFDGVDYKFNLPGPDLSAGELSGMLDKIQGQQLVVNMTSCSGASLAALKKQGRAVIMATKSGTEKNATVFSRYWAEALRDPSSDTDKNEVITALEAFRFAATKTTRFYETAKRLATEHAQIEDTGSKDAVRDPTTENGQGMLAARFALLRIGRAQAAAATPAKRKLVEQKEALEQQFAQLRYQKAAMAADDYKKKLSALLIQLAQVQAEIDK